MKKCLSVSVILLALSFTAHGILINDFDDGTLGGWTVFGDNSIYNSLTDASPIIPVSGDPTDGFLWGRDTRGGTRIFEAPDTYHGDLYGHTLCYDYLVGTTTNKPNIVTDISHIRITDGIDTLVMDLGVFKSKADLGQWQNVAVTLDETETTGSGWYLLTGRNYNSNGSQITKYGRTATNSEIQRVFSNVQGLRLGSEVINGDFNNEEEFIAINNVQMLPEPITVAFLGLGGALLLRAKRHRA